MLLGHTTDALVSVGVIFINIFVSVFQEIRAKAPDGVPAEIASIYVDTAGAFHPGAIAAARAVLPGSHILYGSDFPYSSSAEAVAGLAANGLPAEALSGIERGNALALFPHLTG